MAFHACLLLVSGVVTMHPIQMLGSVECVVDLNVKMFLLWTIISLSNDKLVASFYACFSLADSVVIVLAASTLLSVSFAEIRFDAVYFELAVCLCFLTYHNTGISTHDFQRWICCSAVCLNWNSSGFYTRGSLGFSLFWISYACVFAWLLHTLMLSFDSR